MKKTLIGSSGRLRAASREPAAEALATTETARRTPLAAISLDITAPTSLSKRSFRVR
jgi:hypothetical protein